MEEGRGRKGEGGREREEGRGRKGEGGREREEGRGRKGGREAPSGIHSAVYSCSGLQSDPNQCQLQ